MTRCPGQEWIDWADDQFSREHRRRLLGRRRCCMEGRFADAANNHHFKRARWRGLANMRIQNLLIAACQNLRKLLKAANHLNPLAGCLNQPSIEKEPPV